MTPFTTIHTAIHAARTMSDLSAIPARYHAEFAALPVDEWPDCAKQLYDLRAAKISAMERGVDIERRRVAA